jgi:hypothetical protein
MLDLVVAVSIGTLSAMFATGVPGEISTAAMATLPLLLVPAFLVPLFFMLHIAVLLQSRQPNVRGWATSAPSALADGGPPPGWTTSNSSDCPLCGDADSRHCRPVGHTRSA